MEALDIVRKSGLGESQAKVYLALLGARQLTAVKLAEVAGINRTNVYNILEVLVRVNLVERVDAKKQTFRATHPSNLEILAEKRRKAMVQNEKTLGANLGSLIELFHVNQQFPGARSLAGVAGVKKAYSEALMAKADVYFIRSTADVALPRVWWREYRDELKRLEVKTYGLVQDTALARANILSGRNKEVGVEVVLMPEEVYTAPVAVQIFGEKVALIQFSGSITTTIIDSEALSGAFLQIWQILAEHFRGSYPQEVEGGGNLRAEAV